MALSVPAIDPVGDEPAVPSDELVVPGREFNVLNLFRDFQACGTNSSCIKVNPNDPAANRGTETNPDVCFFRVDQLRYDKDYPHREAFANVIKTMNNPAFRFVYVLTGTANGITLHIGVVKDAKGTDKLSASNCRDNILNAFQGNFNGSVLHALKEGSISKEEQESLTRKYKRCGLILGVPSTGRSEDSANDHDFQGIDRLINSMTGIEEGKKWCLAIVCEPVPSAEISALFDRVFDLYNKLALLSKISCQSGSNSSRSFNAAQGRVDGRSKGDAFSEGEQQSETHNQKTNGTQKNYSKQSGTSHQDSVTYTFGKNGGTSDSVSFEIVNKRCMELMRYLDDTLLERLRAGSNTGLFKTAICYMADNEADSDRLKSCLVSLFQGSKGAYCPLAPMELERTGSSNSGFDLLFLLRNLHNAALFKPENEPDTDLSVLLSRPGFGLGTYLTAQEVSIIAGLPQTEVPGLPLLEGVNFGLNLNSNTKQDDEIPLGKMIQNDREIDLEFKIDKKTLNKHVFVAGTTGSGKTTTCLKLLSGAKTPFLVIEPAKTEYRILLDEKVRMAGEQGGQSKIDGDVFVFTLGNDMVAPFRLNPFELLEGENISAHVDMIKATFTSAFPMEASMPQILEEAIYRCYINKGWNITTNEHEGDSGQDDNIYPTISDLLNEMGNVVEEKGFGPELKANYEGSLVSRLSNLTVGSKGSMLDCSHSINFEFLVTNNVILEMEEVKSPEDKALLMGFILSRLSAYVKKMHEKNPAFRHVTLVEEAHRLLAKTDFSDGGARKNAVAAFTDMLAEVRKYGECLIIADQIPDKLAPEVLKNTNTKIIHKLFARDDKEAVGETMLMDDKQKNYLSALKTGHAVVFSEQTPKPIHVKVGKCVDTSAPCPGNKAVLDAFEHADRKKMGKPYDDLEMLTGNLYEAFRSMFDRFKEKIVRPPQPPNATDEDRKREQRETEAEKIRIRDGFAVQLQNELRQNAKKEAGQREDGSGKAQEKAAITQKALWENLFRQYARKKGAYNSNPPDLVEEIIRKRAEIFCKDSADPRNGITSEDIDFILYNQYNSF